MTTIVLLQHKGIEIWARPVTPIFENYFSYALAFVNRRTDGTPSDVAVALHEMGLLSPTGYRIQVKCTFKIICTALYYYCYFYTLFLSYAGFVRRCRLRSTVSTNKDQGQSKSHR